MQCREGWGTERREGGMCTWVNVNQPGSVVIVKSRVMSKEPLRVVGSESYHSWSAVVPYQMSPPSQKGSSPALARLVSMKGWG